LRIFASLLRDFGCASIAAGGIGGSGVPGGDGRVSPGYSTPIRGLKSARASGKVRASIFSQPVFRQEVWIMPDYKIAPSILSADFARLGEEVDNVLKAGADIVHFDVMDNHYVPNLTIGPLVCEALRKHGVTAEIDVHLMVKPVDRIIPDFAKAGASYITFHPEGSEHIDRSLQLIKGEGCKAGLVFNPATPLDYLNYVIDKVDMVLLMSVNPGFGGQSFIPTALDKLREARKIIDASGRDIRLEIDGGVKVDNIREIAAAGADTFVAGSAIFGAASDGDPNVYDTVIKAMRDELAKA